MFKANVVGAFMQNYHISKEFKLSTKKKAEHCSTQTNEVDLAQQQGFYNRNES